MCKWQNVTFDADELEPGQPSELKQFNFDLMCAEIFQEDNGRWVAVLIDTDGNETWVSEPMKTAESAKWELISHLKQVMDDWLRYLVAVLP